MDLNLDLTVNELRKKATELGVSLKAKDNRKTIINKIRDKINRMNINQETKNVQFIQNFPSQEASLFVNPETSYLNPEFSPKIPESSFPKFSFPGQFPAMKVFSTYGNDISFLTSIINSIPLQINPNATFQKGPIVSVQ